MPVIIERPALERELLRELEAGTFLVLTGFRGAGKSTLLRRIQEQWHGPAVLAQLEAIACSPEVLRDELLRLGAGVLARVSGKTPLETLHDALAKRSRESLLLLDDVTEIRTLSYSPGVERPLETFLEALTQGKAAAMVTTRFGYWMRQQFPDLTYRAIARLSVDELSAAGAMDAALVVSASGGLPVHARHLFEYDVGGALTRELLPGGAIETECRATLSELLHRARGYGACRSVLRALAHEEGGNLTEVSRYIDRTPGSTRDYLRWLEEVDLVVARDKRYFYADPVLRLWMRLYGRGAPPSEGDIAAEVAVYLGRLATSAVDAHLGTTTTEAAEEELYTFPPPPSEDLVEID